MAKQKVMALEKAHEVSNFDCGNSVLNDWLRTKAGQHQRNGMSRTFVLIDPSKPPKVLGFVALAHRDVTPKEDLPPEINKRLPSKVSGYTVARLAVSIDAQRQGHGERLLLEAMQRAYRATQLVGGYALFVDAKDGAADFYRKYGFLSLPDDPDTLVYPIASMPHFPSEEPDE